MSDKAESKLREEAAGMRATEAKLRKRLNAVCDEVDQAAKRIVSTLWKDDDSDFRHGLWDALGIIRPDLCNANGCLDEAYAATHSEGERDEHPTVKRLDQDEPDGEALAPDDVKAKTADEVFDDREEPHLNGVEDWPLRDILAALRGTNEEIEQGLSALSGLLNERKLLQAVIAKAGTPTDASEPERDIDGWLLGLVGADEPMLAVVPGPGRGGRGSWGGLEAGTYSSEGATVVEVDREECQAPLGGAE